jgi:hypothetical protein
MITSMLISLIAIVSLSISQAFTTLPAKSTASIVPITGSLFANSDPFQYYSSGDVNATRDVKLDVSVKRKKKGSTFKVADDRDNLPFVVKVTTPDPYTKPEIKKAQAIQATREDRKKRGGAFPQNIAASIFISKDNTLHPILGEFQLDKHTTNGDILQVGDKQFKVQKATCQYKYVGGQKFAMVRKILEVKELTRVLAEEIITRQFQATIDDDSILELE